MAKPNKSERASALNPTPNPTNEDGSMNAPVQETAVTDTNTTEAPAGIGADLAAAAQAGGGTAQKRAPASNFLPIVSGRLPLVFVHRIRFGETAGTNELAKTFGTSVGKVFDIKKGRNFGYIHADWMPTQADIDTAKGWVESLTKPNKHGLPPVGDAAHLSKVIDEYVTRGLASADQLAKQEALRARSKPGGSGSGAIPAAAPAEPMSAPAAAADLLG